MELVECKLCGNKYECIPAHLKKHNINIKEYLKKFPGIELLSKSWINKISGKNNHFFGKKHSKKTKKSISDFAKTRTGKKNPFYGKHHSLETIEKFNSEKFKNNVRNAVIQSYKNDKKGILEKRKQTSLKHFGTEHPMKSIKLKNNMRKKCEENGLWVPLNKKSNWKLYQRKVRLETNKWKIKLFEMWDGKCFYTKDKLIIDKKNFSNPLYRTIDHKISVYYGFINNIVPEIIGHIDNLCICSRNINSFKCSYSIF